MLQVCGSGYRAIDLIATATVGPDYLKQVIISIRTGGIRGGAFLVEAQHASRSRGVFAVCWRGYVCETGFTRRSEKRLEQRSRNRLVVAVLLKTRLSTSRMGSDVIFPVRRTDSSGRQERAAVCLDLEGW